MKIYTSYFSNAKKLAMAGIKIIGIAQYPPKWFNGVSLRILAPSPSILHEESFEVYKQRFDEEIIGKLNAREIMAQIEQISKGRDVALCCYEKDRNGCHRKIVGDWITRETGIKVEEYESKPQYMEQSLF